MGVAVILMGSSGSGKSSSLRNLDPNKVGIFNVASKPLPFRNKFKNIMNHANYEAIEAGLTKNALKTYVIDDSQYLMAFESFARAKETGYQKFTDMAINYAKLFEIIRDKTSDDTIVYVLSHIDRDETGRVKLKTLGKMLDNQMCVEGLCSIVLMTETDGKKFWIRTSNDGYSTVKAPMGMFEKEMIDNDLAIVDKTIREYYGFNEVKEAKK